MRIYRESKRKPTPFEAELIDYLAYLTEVNEDEALIEVLCRKLYKHGLIEKEGNLWVLNAEQTEPKGGEEEMITQKR